MAANSISVPELSPFARQLVDSLTGNPGVKKQSRSHLTYTEVETEPMKKGEKPTLMKSILNVLNGPRDSIERLAFETDPAAANRYQGLYRQKTRLLPDSILKRIMIQDDLVASIVNTRSNQVAAFGRPRPDRFSIGFTIEPDNVNDLSPQEKDKIFDQIDVATKRLLTCGSIKGWESEDKVTFSQYLFMSTKNAVGLGRIATEVIWVRDASSGKKVFHSFRPIDAGTIYRTVPQAEAAKSVRKQARALLESLKNKKIEPERFENDEYSWVQVIEGRPVQAFTSQECLVHNFYPSTDVELDGYPITPIDTVISAVTQHINITSHNKLYFQNGRASRGMLVIKSDDIDENVVARVRQQFNASINNVNNSWRMPVFGVGSEDEIAWQPIDSGGRDMEFQYLSDTNARVILSAFQMSPEELPGYAHLSRGTASQALAESNQEYVLTAHRDVGIRPLLKQWEDFINGSIFPLIDPELATKCKVKLVGLDSETAEKESIRIQQDAPVHMTYNEILAKVEKDPVDKLLGGDFPLSPAFQAILDKYVPVGLQMERFFGVTGASQDPRYAYIRDPFYFQNIQMQQQMQMQQQQAQMQAQQGPPQGGGAPPSGGGGGGGQSDQSAGADQQSAQQDDQKANDQAGQELNQGLDQAQSALGKAERQLTSNQKRLLAQHDRLVSTFMEKWKADSEAAIADIAAAIPKV